MNATHHKSSARFDTLASQSRSSIEAFARRICRDRSTAEDMTQEALARAFSRFDRFDPVKGHFSKWVCKILLNLYREYLRVRRNQEVSFSAIMGDEFDTDHDSYSATLDRSASQSQAIQQAKGVSDPETEVLSELHCQELLSQLTERERRCVLAVHAGSDYRTAAREVGISYHAFCKVMSRLHQRMRLQVPDEARRGNRKRMVLLT